MGQFPYHCPKCQGAEFRCGQPQNHCERCGEISDSKDEECLKSGHILCHGGQFCWSEDIVAIPEPQQKYCLEDDVLKFVVRGKYDGYGGIEEIENEEHKHYRYYDVGTMTEINGNTPEQVFEGDSEDGDMSDVVLVRFWCKYCYELTQQENKQQEKTQEEKMQEKVKQEDKKMYQCRECLVPTFEKLYDALSWDMCCEDCWIEAVCETCHSYPEHCDCDGSSPNCKCGEWRAKHPQEEDKADEDEPTQQESKTQPFKEGKEGAMFQPEQTISPIKVPQSIAHTQVRKRKRRQSQDDKMAQTCKKTTDNGKTDPRPIASRTRSKRAKYTKR